MRRQMDEVWAEYDRKRIIARLKAGREARAKKGNMSGGNLAYGYAAYAEPGEKTRGIKIVEEEAEIIRRIFAWVDQAIEVNHIVVRLNTSGARMRNGNVWTARQVRRVLSRRPLYAKGIVRYGEARGVNKSLILLT